MAKPVGSWAEVPILDLATPLREVKGIGPRRSDRLSEAQCRTVEDLLFTLPFRYEDRSHFISLGEISPGRRVTVSGKIVSSLLRRIPGRGMTLFEIRVQDSTGTIVGLWFNQPYLRKILKPDREVVLFGETVEPPRGRGPLQLRNPQFEILGKDPERIHTGRIVPVYRRMGSLSTRQLRTLIHRILASLPSNLAEPLPPEMLRRLGLPSRARALQEVHFPQAGTDPELLQQGLEPAHRRLALEELFLLQMEFVRARHARASQTGCPCLSSEDRIEALERCLPFPLTAAQRRAYREIARDLAGPHPMYRLLQGDVGSGKTVVAFLAALLAVESGFQVALMVPTEILAAQHFRSLGQLMEKRRCRFDLLTAGQGRSHRQRVLADLATGIIDLLVGTHSLIQQTVRFRKLGLVIVDEQQRFGVRQRARLRGKGVEPHFLLMTATPIPRSLALTLYGDLDLSIIDGSPPGRSPVATVLKNAGERERIYAFIREQAEQGHRTAIVYPLANESERRDLASATEEARRLSEGPLHGLGVGLLHGQMAWEEKCRVMEAFSEGSIRVLVATTVLEVGVDVPEARVILVEHAERFGLSQLHQLRGRVGRGGGPAWCFLVPGGSCSETAAARLEILTETPDGFQISRRDLQLRGPGQFKGLRQSGETELRVTDLARDGDLVGIARAEAIRAGSHPSCRGSAHRLQGLPEAVRPEQSS